MVTIPAMGVPDEENGSEKRSAGGKSGPEGKEILPVSEAKKCVLLMAYVLKIEGIVRIPLSGKVRFPFRLRKRELPRENTPVADGTTDESFRDMGRGAPPRAGAALGALR